MKNILTAIAISLLLMSVQGCQIQLDSKDVQFFKVEEVNSSPITLKISGLVFHSALAVQEITKSVDGPELFIQVKLTPVSKGLSGNFSYEVIIPQAVNVVYFGSDKKIIWERRKSGKL